MCLMTPPDSSFQNERITPINPSAYKPLDQMHMQCNAFRPECINNNKRRHVMLVQISTISCCVRQQFKRFTPHTPSAYEVLY